MQQVNFCLNGWLVNARRSGRRIELVASSVCMAIKSIFCCIFTLIINIFYNKRMKVILSQMITKFSPDNVDEQLGYLPSCISSSSKYNTYDNCPGFIYLGFGRSGVPRNEGFETTQYKLRCSCRCHK
jgi:hypothetical protein